MLSALDVLYMVLAIAIALLAIFGSIVLVYAILILRDVNKASTAVKDSAERVNAMVVKPIKMTKDIMNLAKPVVEVAERRMRQHAEKADETKPKKKSKKKK